MRHSYYWWVTSVLVRLLPGGMLLNSSEFGLDRVDLGYAGRWADQEAVVRWPGGKEVRAKTSQIPFRGGHVAR